MIDSEFEKRGRAMKGFDALEAIETYKQANADLRDEVRQLRARIAELERENANMEDEIDAAMKRAEKAEADANQTKLLDALRETIGQMEHEANTQHAAALDLQEQRDAAIADARELAGYADYARRVTTIFYTHDEIELIKKYLQPLASVGGEQAHAVFCPRRGG